MADNYMQKKCDFCGEAIPANAGRCAYCGSILEVVHYPVEEQGTAEPQGSGEPQNLPEGEDANQDAMPPQEHGPNAEHYSQAQYNARNTLYNARNTQYNAERPYYKANYTEDFGSDKKPLSNGLKVLLTVLFTILPGVGQLAGIITAIVFMNAEDKDRKSFGVALLVACLAMFVLACIGCFVLGLASQSVKDYW